MTFFGEKRVGIGRFMHEKTVKSYIFNRLNDALWCSKCHISTGKMPQLIIQNATLCVCPSVAFYLLKCGILDDKVWHFKSFSIEL